LLGLAGRRQIPSALSQPLRQCLLRLFPHRAVIHDMPKMG
jgi:hypothetical protein